MNMKVNSLHGLDGCVLSINMLFTQTWSNKGGIQLKMVLKHPLQMECLNFPQLTFPVLQNLDLWLPFLQISTMDA